MDEPSDKPHRKRKSRKRKAKGKPRGIHVVRANDKTPFKYDAKPVLKMHIGAGRPTGYNELRGDEIVAFMAGGLSITAASAVMGFCSETIHEWARRHTEFSAALKRGRACRTLYLERKLLASVDSASVTASIFGLKNAAPTEWRDKHELEHNTAPDDPLLAFLRSINGNVLRPVTPPVTMEGDCTDVTNPKPPQIEGPPRPFGGPQQ